MRKKKQQNTSLALPFASSVPVIILELAKPVKRHHYIEKGVLYFLVLVFI